MSRWAAGAGVAQRGVRLAGRQLRIRTGMLLLRLGLWSDHPGSVHDHGLWDRQRHKLVPPGVLAQSLTAAAGPEVRCG